VWFSNVKRVTVRLVSWPTIVSAFSLFPATTRHAKTRHHRQDQEDDDDDDTQTKTKGKFHIFIIIRLKRRKENRGSSSALSPRLATTETKWSNFKLFVSFFFLKFVFEWRRMWSSAAVRCSASLCCGDCQLTVGCSNCSTNTQYPTLLPYRTARTVPIQT